MAIISDLLTRVGVLLRDVEHRQWETPELISWYNESLTEIVRIRPEAHSLMVAQALVAGAVQPLPADGIQLLRVSLCKMSGKAPRRILMETMNTSAPSWQTDTSMAAVKRYVLDEDNPRQYFVYPPNDATGLIDLVYSANPIVATVVGDTFSLPAIYETVVVNYILFRAFGKLSEDHTNSSQAGNYYSMFAEAMGITDIISKKKFLVTKEPAQPRRAEEGLIQ